MNKPPETIYLQCYDETGELLNLVHDDVTWCVDQINERDAVYTLASRVDYWQRREAASQRALTLALKENRVRDECLEIAKKALEYYDHLGLAISRKALAQINERLAELGPAAEEKDSGRLKKSKPETRYEQLEELLNTAHRWRLMLNTFERMRNSIHLGVRYQALGIPARDIKAAENAFWRTLAGLELEPEEVTE